MFKIEKAIALIPSKRSSKYPFHQMEIGDSFAVPRELEHSVRARAYQFNKTSKDRHFVVRVDKQANTLRVWCLSRDEVRA